MASYNNSYYAFLYWQKTLTKINTKLPAIKGVRNRYCSNADEDDFETEVNSCQFLFYSCVSLTSIPTGLFDNNTTVTNFASCFRNCTSLTSIPEGLFSTNAKVTTFAYCFYNTFKFDGSIHIGSEVVKTAANFMYSSSSYDRYVYVPADSTTADTFNALSISGMTVVEE